MGFRDPNFRASRLMRLRVIAALREQDELTEDLTWTTGQPLAVPPPPMPRPRSELVGVQM